MAVRPERILLIRSGRHLRTALDALAAHVPGSHIGVVGTPGSEAALADAGIAEPDRFIFSARPRFSPFAFLFSLTAIAVLRWRYGRVAVLWNDPDGRGQGNVNRTAMMLSPSGYLAVAPDGSVVERTLCPELRTECRRVATSLWVGAALGLLLYVPAAILAWRRR